MSIFSTTLIMSASKAHKTNTYSNPPPFFSVLITPTLK